MGAKRPADDSVTVKLSGSAGQSLGAFLVEGFTVEVSGDANDYCGKGLSGGRIVVRQPENAPRAASDNIIVGNTCLYGATAGEAFFNGMAGERFAVRNSGASAVVEGIGDHGCEYMTGGTVVVLGKTGRNFAAGMSGGIALVYDPEGAFKAQCNMMSVGLGPVEDPAALKALVEAHRDRTGSARAGELLANWDKALGKFLLVMPTDYRRALESLAAAREDLAA
jgi:glutamate synthase (NADPH/NADH) large chain